MYTISVICSIGVAVMNMWLGLQKAPPLQLLREMIKSEYEADSHLADSARFIKISEGTSKEEQKNTGIQFDLAPSPNAHPKHWGVGRSGNLITPIYNKDGSVALKRNMDGKFKNDNFTNFESRRSLPVSAKRISKMKLIIIIIIK